MLSNGVDEVGEFEDFGVEGCWVASLTSFGRQRFFWKWIGDRRGGRREVLGEGEGGHGFGWRS